MLANPEVDAVYCAVPHDLHEEFYCDIIKSGKHLLGEKPFGIDKKANEAILKCIAEHPEVFVRCSSEFPYYPPMQKIGKLLETEFFGKIIEVNSIIAPMIESLYSCKKYIESLKSVFSQSELKILKIFINMLIYYLM